VVVYYEQLGNGIEVIRSRHLIPSSGSTVEQRATDQLRESRRLFEAMTRAYIIPMPLCTIAIRWIPPVYQPVPFVLMLIFVFLALGFSHLKTHRALGLRAQVGLTTVAFKICRCDLVELTAIPLILRIAVKHDIVP
jgi:hypothetical protein